MGSTVTVPVVQETMGSTVSGAQETMGSTVPGVQETTGSTVAGAQETIGATVSGAQETIGATVPGVQETTGSTVAGAQETIGATVSGAQETMGSTVAGAQETMGSTVAGAQETMGSTVAGAQETMGSTVAGAQETKGATVSGTQKMRRPGEGVKIVDVTKDKSNVPHFTVAEKDLHDVLMQDHIKDHPVVVISITGEYREGKSFFMNLVELFLRNQGGDNWLSPESAKLDCFEWRAGIESCTSGIWICPDPFVLEGPDGDKVVVVLMDTQGTSDPAAEVRECSTVFALSTLVSGLQVYNLKGKFSREDLASLRLFVDYSRAAQTRGGLDRPFQALKYLIRDYDQEEFPLDAEGGRRFLERQRQLEQPNDQLGDVAHGFETVDCFLLPFPWVDMRSRSLADLSEEFKRQVTDLLSTTLAWENVRQLVKKDLNGFEVTSKDLFQYIKGYVDVFEKGDLPSPTSAYEVNVELSLRKAGREALCIALRVFNDATTEIFDQHSPSLKIKSLNETLNVAKTQAVQCFKHAVEQVRDLNNVLEGYLSELLQDIENRTRSLVTENSLKKCREREQRMKEVEEERKRNEVKRKKLRLASKASVAGGGVVGAALIAISFIPVPGIAPIAMGLRIAGPYAANAVSNIAAQAFEHLADLPHEERAEDSD